MRRRMRLGVRRGAVGVGMVAALVVVEVIVVVSVVGGGAQHDLTLQRIETNRAFYAAEAGLMLALREVWTGTDEDGDGIVGGVSADGDGSNDPEIGGGTTSVQVVTAGPLSTLEATGRSDRAKRRVEMQVSSG